MSAAKSLKFLLSIACFSFAPIALVAFSGERSSVAVAQEQSDVESENESAIAFRQHSAIELTEDANGEIQPVTINGRLDGNSARFSNGEYYDSYSFKGEAGQVILINLTSRDFDTFLALRGLSGEIIARNDDGSATNSRIVLELPTTGSYTIVATSSIPGETGSYTLALRAATAADLAIAEADRLYSQGYRQRRIGQYQAALESLQQALELYRTNQDYPSEGRAINGLAMVSTDQGQYAQALDYYQRALVIFNNIGDQDGEGGVLNNMGEVYRYLGQYLQALEHYQQALLINIDIDDRRDAGTILGNIGLIYSYLKQYSQALEYYQQALVIARSVDDREGEGAILGNIGTAYGNLGQYSQALEYYQQALAINIEIGDYDRKGITLGNIGILLAQQNQPELAIVFLKQSVNITEQIRSSNRELSPELQQSYTETIAATYRELADLLLQQDRIIEAQQVLDLLKVQELGDYLQNVRGTDITAEGIPPRPPEAAIEQTINSSIDRIIALNRELAELEAIPPDQRTPAQVEQLQELRSQEIAQIEQFQKIFDDPAIVENIGRLRQTTGNQSIDLNNFRNLQESLAKLPQNAALLYPFVLNDRIELILVTESGVPIRQTVPVDRGELNEAIRQFREALQSPNSDAIAPAQQLYRWLVEPLESALTAAEIQILIYAPDGPLRYIPLAALHDGDQWLAERLQVNNITAASLTDITALPRLDPTVLAGAVSEGRSITVGGETFTFSDLPYAEREVAALVERLPNTRSRLNQDLTLSIATDAQDYSIVHLATHAKFVQGVPEQSFILLGDDGANGGYATLDQISSWNLRNIDLIVLSACETGVGDSLGDGREILGLGYQMQTAGADAVVASLWSVSDGGTQILMDVFYTALANGYSKTEALQRAQQALITGDLAAVGEPRGLTIEMISTGAELPIDVSNNLSHPYYWAPFILIGNGL